jgi:hypothetical protein
MAANLVDPPSSHLDSQCDDCISGISASLTEKTESVTADDVSGQVSEPMLLFATETELRKCARKNSGRVRCRAEMVRRSGPRQVRQSILQRLMALPGHRKRAHHIYIYIFIYIYIYIWVIYI